MAMDAPSLLHSHPALTLASLRSFNHPNPDLCSSSSLCFRPQNAAPSLHLPPFIASSSSSMHNLAAIANPQQTICAPQERNLSQEDVRCSEHGDQMKETDTADGSAPLVAALAACATQNAAAFHFPGHRRGAAAPGSLANRLAEAAFAFDLPELPELDNLHAPQGAIADAQRNAAVAFGADATWFLVNGSTCGIHAAVMATCKPGEYLILPRNCHMSAISAMVISGTLPKYTKPYLDRVWEIAHGVNKHDVERAIVERG